jgi:pimeloyl-ACP methyl ester carboxylesterase
VPVPAGLSDAAVIIYLHGFASSARSTKASYFAERLRRHGLSFSCPDFNEPDFSTLTITRMLDQIAVEVDAANEASVTLMGSSLGGAMAVLAADRLRAKVESVILLAPAVMFAKPGHHLLPAERIDEWRRQGSLPFFHFGYNEQRSLSYSFYEDSLQYDPMTATFAQPALIFQGLRDASVDPGQVEQFAAARRNVTLSLLDDDHQLLESLPKIWQDTEAFLGLID